MSLGSTASSGRCPRRRLTQPVRLLRVPPTANQAEVASPRKAPNE